MLYLLFSFVMFYAWWHVKDMPTEQDVMADIFKHALFFTGAFFLLHTVYLYILLPAQIKSFYNDGIGLEFQNAGGSNFIYAKNDERILYYQAQTNLDWWVIDIIKSYLSYGFVVVLMLFMVWYAWNYGVFQGPAGVSQFNWRNPTMKFNTLKKVNHEEV